MKNVYAIAAGIVAGKKLGASAHAALVTRGFAEMARFGAALGARRETLSGLSGLGDLVLTCGSAQSRNMSLGIELGKGQSLEDVLASGSRVTEGVYTASALVEMAAAHGIDMPIAQAVHAVISGLATVDEAIEALLARPLRRRGLKLLPLKAGRSARLRAEREPTSPRSPPFRRRESSGTCWTVDQPAQ